MQMHSPVTHGSPQIRMMPLFQEPLLLLKIHTTIPLRVGTYIQPFKYRHSLCTIMHQKITDPQDPRDANQVPGKSPTLPPRQAIEVAGNSQFTNRLQNTSPVQIMTRVWPQLCKNCWSKGKTQTPGRLMAQMLLKTPKSTAQRTKGMAPRHPPETWIGQRLRARWVNSEPRPTHRRSRRFWCKRARRIRY